MAAKKRKGIVGVCKHHMGRKPKYKGFRTAHIKNPYWWENIGEAYESRLTPNQEDILETMYDMRAENMLPTAAKYIAAACKIETNRKGSNISERLRSLMMKGLVTWDKKGSKRVWYLCKDEESISYETAREILEKPQYGGRQLNNNLAWRREELEKLSILCGAKSDVVKSAQAIGREPQTIAKKAEKMGLEVPCQWLELIRPEYIPVAERPGYIPKPDNLNYPFIIEKRDEHTDVLIVNDLVSKNLPDDMRSDICQEILVDIYSGKLSTHTLRGPNGKQILKEYYSRYRKQNYEKAGYGILHINELDEDRTYYDIAAGLSQKDMVYNEISGQRRMYQSYRTHHPAIQEEDLYHKEVMDFMAVRHKNEEYIEYDEALLRVEKEHNSLSRICATKKTFRTEEDAYEGKRIASAKYGDGSLKGKTLRVYKCPLCPYWHLTTEVLHNHHYEATHG